MEHERPHLDRQKGDLEVGYANAIGNGEEMRMEKHAGPVAEAPQWLLTWEARRPIWLVELFAEALGVWMYVLPGMGATASFLVTSAAKVAGFGSLLNIAIAYAFGIVFALLLAAPVSGGHLSPGFTISFVVLKGFPARKALQFITAQIFGGFISGLCVYAMYRDSLNAVSAGHIKAGEPLAIFTAQGPAGVFALFPTPGVSMANTFGVEFICCIVLSVVVFCVIDPRNPLVSPTSGPFIIGGAYLAVIIAFASQAVALNSARDVGGRLACAAIYGRQCWSAYPGYAALAALTNIPASVIGGLIHTLLLSDQSKPIIHMPAPPTESGGSMRVLTRDTGHMKE